MLACSALALAVDSCFTFVYINYIVYMTDDNNSPLEWWSGERMSPVHQLIMFSPRVTVRFLVRLQVRLCQSLGRLKEQPGYLTVTHRLTRSHPLQPAITPNYQHMFCCICTSRIYRLYIWQYCVFFQEQRVVNSQQYEYAKRNTQLPVNISHFGIEEGTGT